MLKVDLNGPWRMKCTQETEWIDARVPGSVFHDLLTANKIRDPFYRDNEDDAREIASKDYEYEREFTVPAEVLACDCVLLTCEGLDTLAEIAVNGYFIAATDNMHRTYEFDVKPWLRAGENTIRIVFASPIRFVEKMHKENPIWGVDDAIPGYPHLRKAHCMFGWDWGPQIPDSGIWRSISINAYRYARLDDIYITQQHHSDSVDLDIRVRTNCWSGENLELKAVITAPDGKITETAVSTAQKEEHLRIRIQDPQLWWPNGFGKQPLYNVTIVLSRDGVQLESKEYTVGLRTLTVKREKDAWGESFAFEVNGKSLFAMGADYIPEDNLLPRSTPERTERLIRDCVEANFNCIRVWGGGIYPEDWFFDQCDRYGLIVWHDLMFACAVYEMSDAFTENIRREAEDNIRRIRHHACLGMWCGNNEMEWGWDCWGFPKTPKHRTDYIKQFEVLLPQVAKETDPNTFYWLASPSSGGGFDNPNDENRGDVHFWDVWHGLKPFTEYRKHNFRFVSEFGFESFPSLKTIESFTLPEDRNIFSYVMEKHQKCKSGNGKILYYISENLKYPKDFSSLIYASQLMQAEAIKYGVEHWRRHRGQCMGAVYWQLNDCWPVASWASIDSFGRWKALHYFAKRFFAPVLVSANEEDTRVELHLTNETLEPVKGQIMWKLRDNRCTILREGVQDAELEPLSAKMCISLDFADVLTTGHLKRSTYVEFAFVSYGKCISSGTALFVRAKHFEFLKPQITAAVKEEAEHFVLSFSTDVFAKYLEVELAGMDCVFSDNYFDLSAGEVRDITVRKDSLSRPATLEQITAGLTTRSIYDMAEANDSTSTGSHIRFARFLSL